MCFGDRGFMLSMKMAISFLVIISILPLAIAESNYNEADTKNPIDESGPNVNPQNNGIIVIQDSPTQSAEVRAKTYEDQEMHEKAAELYKEAYGDEKDPIHKADLAYSAYRNYILCKNRAEADKYWTHANQDNPKKYSVEETRENVQIAN